MQCPAYYWKKCLNPHAENIKVHKIDVRHYYYQTGPGKELLNTFSSKIKKQYGILWLSSLKILSKDLDELTLAVCRLMSFVAGQEWRLIHILPSLCILNDHENDCPFYAEGFKRYIKEKVNQALSTSEWMGGWVRGCLSLYWQS